MPAKVTVSYMGQSKHARAHVRVKDRFDLTADPTMVAPGRIVAFTPYLNYQQSAAGRWRWVPDVASWDSIAGCTSGSKCYRVMVSSGTMWAYLSSEPGSDSASVAVTVNEECSGSASRAAKMSPTINGKSSQAARMDVTCEGGGAGSTEVDSLPKHNLTLSEGTDVTGGMARVDSIPAGVVVPYHFASIFGDSASAIVVVDDTVATESGVIRMLADHSVDVLLKAPSSWMDSLSFLEDGELFTPAITCPSDKALIANTLILNRLGILIDSTLADSIEHGSFALADSVGTISLGPILHGTARQVPQMVPPPTNACMGLHAHPFGPQFVEPPSPGDVLYGQTFHIVQMVVTMNYVYFVDNMGTRRLLGRRVH